MKNQKRLDNKGFSLVELIVVIAIMAVLMGVLAPTLIGNIEKSRESTDLQNLDTIRGAVVTAMADEAVHKEVMTAAGTTGVTFELGSAGSASVDSLAATGKTVTQLKAALKEIITSSIAMKSSQANGTGNKVYVHVSKDGVVTAFVGSDATTVINCKKTKDETGAAKQLLSGASITGSGSGTPATP